MSSWHSNSFTVISKNSVKTCCNKANHVGQMLSLKNNEVFPTMITPSRKRKMLISGVFLQLRVKLNVPGEPSGRQSRWAWKVAQRSIFLFLFFFKAGDKSPCLDNIVGRLWIECHWILLNGGAKFFSALGPFRKPCGDDTMHRCL